MASKSKKNKKFEPVEAEGGEAMANSEFNLLDRAETFGATLKEQMEDTYRRKKRTPVIFEQDKIVRDFLPVDSLYLQWCIDNRGIEKRTLFEIVGPDSTGKSSFLYWLMGGWMRHNVPGTMFAGEDKLMKKEWVLKLLSSDRDMAEKMIKVLNVQRMRVLDEILFALQATVDKVRSPESPNFVPPHIPFVIAIDLINKVATADQAGGIKTGFGDFSKEDVSDLGDKGHNWDRAKAYHDLINRANLLICESNLVFLITNHQNDQATGKKNSSPFAAEWQEGLAHRTKPGGNSINQTTALQLIFQPRGQIYCEGKAIASRVVVKPFKNSYGTNRRTCAFAIVPGDEASGPIDTGLRWDLTTVEWFAEEGFFGMKRLASSPATAPEYSCNDLGLRGANIVEAAAAVAAIPASDLEELGRTLKIPGYYYPLEEAVKDTQQSE